jgi:hypothetical protein
VLLHWPHRLNDFDQRATSLSIRSLVCTWLDPNPTVDEEIPRRKFLSSLHDLLGRGFGERERADPCIYPLAANGFGRLRLDDLNVSMRTFPTA